MPSMKAIKRRRGTVKNIQQITNAMHLVATSKLQKVKSLRDGPFVTETKRILMDAAVRMPSHPMINLRAETTCAAYVAITSDRGLCGGYNQNLCKAVLSHAEAEGVTPHIIAVGTKARDFFKRRGPSSAAFFNAPSDTASYTDAEKISQMLLDLYTTEKIDIAYIAYTQFETVLSQEVRIDPILPIGAWLAAQEIPVVVDDELFEMEYDCGISDFVSFLTPLFVSAYMYGAMAESITSEQASRMVSMDSATNNAQDIIEDLTLAYNRQRQGIITQEITEIVSGANALQ